MPAAAVSEPCQPLTVAGKPESNTQVSNASFRLEPPIPVSGDVVLPRTRLHYVRAGSGPPLVIVPATVSRVEQWITLVQFMAQRYTTYFFELPGHGKSSPYPQKFNSGLVPATVAAFMESQGYGEFSLMGFSFGGLLALRTVEALQERIRQVILLSPCVSRQALKYSPYRQWALRRLCSTLKTDPMQRSMYRILHYERIETPLATTLSKVFKINPAILLNKGSLKLPLSTLDVLAYTGCEIFTLDFDSPVKPFKPPCYFGMSIYDDLLDFDITLANVRRHFDRLMVTHFTLPYHQPPKPPTFDWLVREFGHFLNILPEVV
jgi:pimeloyl-ACP methyl ester carboxylesterase